VGGTLVTLLQTGSLHLTAAGFSLTGLLVAVLGAIVAIWLWNVFTRRAV